jgi:hypothetical protein
MTNHANRSLGRPVTSVLGDVDNRGTARVFHIDAGPIITSRLAIEDAAKQTDQDAASAYRYILKQIDTPSESRIMTVRDVRKTWRELGAAYAWSLKQYGVAIRNAHALRDLLSTDEASDRFNRADVWLDNANEAREAMRELLLVHPQALPNDAHLPKPV